MRHRSFGVLRNFVLCGGQCRTVISALLLGLLCGQVWVLTHFHEHHHNDNGGGGMKLIQSEERLVDEFVWLLSSSGNKHHEASSTNLTNVTSLQRNIDQETDTDVQEHTQEQAGLEGFEIMSKPNPFPELSGLVSGTKDVLGDISHLLDFAVIGFPKCGTTTMLHYMNQPPHLLVAPSERCELGYNQTAVMAKAMNKLDAKYDSSQDALQPQSKGLPLRGHKCPRDLENVNLSMKLYRQHFPRTKFIVGVRHPVLWFESFYNFRVTMNEQMQNDTARHIGPCNFGKRGVCTHRGMFQYYLASMGKTPLNTKQEEDLVFLNPRLKKKFQNLHLPQKVFLYEMNQLKIDDGDGNQQGKTTGPNQAKTPHSKQFRRDLAVFLGLPDEPMSLPPMVHHKPGEDQLIYYSSEKKQEVQRKKVRICDPQHDKVREVLMQHARKASPWILEYFLKSEDVVVSSPEYFKELLKLWLVDPCEESRKE